MYILKPFVCYKILDHGGIIVAVKSGPERIQTIMVSYDKGDCWLGHTVLEEFRFNAFIAEVR